jgi:hypothetical protein
MAKRHRPSSVRKIFRGRLKTYGGASILEGGLRTEDLICINMLPLWNGKVPSHIIDILRSSVVEHVAFSSFISSIGLGQSDSGLASWHGPECNDQT